MMYFAKNDHPGIMIICPNCNMGARHDTETIGDAIRARSEIECTVCGNYFSIVVTPYIQDNATTEAIPGVVDNIEELWED